LSKQLIYDIASLSNLERAYQKARSGTTKYDKEAMLFAENETDNLLKIQKSLLDGMYEFSGYIRFTVHEPVERIVDAPHFVDKIVQLAILFKVKKPFITCLFMIVTRVSIKKVHTKLLNA